MIDVKAASLGFSLTVVAVYIVCALVFYFFGSAALELFNTWAHGVDLSKIAVSSPRTTAGFFVGLVSVFIFSYLSAAFFALLYNVFCKRRG